MPRNLIKSILILLLVYCISYVAFRTVNIETWENDGKDYVTFPENSRLLYRVFRPLSYIDAALTGTGAHIGPHQ
jgi:hypothetical protein